MSIAERSAGPIKGVYVIRAGIQNLLGMTLENGQTVRYVISNDQLQTIAYMANHVMWADFKLTERGMK